MSVTLNSKEVKGKVSTSGIIATVGLMGSRGAKGDKGDKGEQGENGFSPVITTSKSGKVTTLTITDATGTSTTTINDGADGQGSGDMLTSVYDQNLNGIVDNAEKVNNHTVESDVPNNAVFTDTTYTAGTNVSISSGNVISATDTTYTAGTGIDITNGVITNTQTSAEWGNITGTLSSQTDLKNILDTIPTKLSDLTNDNNTVTDSSYVHTDNNYTSTEKTKLSGIESGAQVNVDEIAIGDESETTEDTKLLVDTSGSTDELKYKDETTGTFKDVYVKALDSMPVGTEVDFDGSASDIPIGWEQVSGKSYVAYDVWANPNLSIAFTPQTLQFTDTYKYYDVIFIQDGLVFKCQRCYVDPEIDYLLENNLGGYIRTRQLRAHGSSMIFGHGNIYTSYLSPTENDYQCIPYKIIGYKEV